MGWWLAWLRSMMDRRRCPNAMPDGRVVELTAVVGAAVAHELGHARENIRRPCVGARGLPAGDRAHQADAPFGASLVFWIEKHRLPALYS